MVLPDSNTRTVALLLGIGKPAGDFPLQFVDVDFDNFSVRYIYIIYVFNFTDFDLNEIYTGVYTILPAILK